MVWLIVAAAIVVLGFGAWAGTGRLGTMPKAVNDRPRPRMPDGPVDAAFLADLRIPLASHGYDTAEVDRYLDEAVVSTATKGPDKVRFRVVRRGYDMQVVDEVLDRLERPATGETGPDGSTN